MADENFKSKVAFIVETDGLLKDYIESIVIKKIKSKMDDSFKNVNTNQIHAAMILKNISPCSLRKFGETMRMSRAAASALVDRMVKAGIVKREANPDNRREVILSVSPDFMKHVTHVRSEMGKWFETLQDRIGPETFEKWYEVMVALNDVLRHEIKSGK